MRTETAPPPRDSPSPLSLSLSLSRADAARVRCFAGATPRFALKTVAWSGRLSADVTLPPGDR
jgi:hypothetical protein